MSIAAYFARVTWNRDGWRTPSGQIPRGEKGTYVVRQGFGHEEWLGRREWTVDGWRYGYIGALSSMLIVGLALYFYFRKIKWL